MKKIALMFTAASFVSLSAWAQAPKSDVRPDAKPEAKPQAAKEAAKPAVLADGGKKTRRTGDARHCLDKSSNTEIIKCAEAYL